MKSIFGCAECHIAGAKNCCDGLPGNPVGRAFVTNRESPASGAPSSSLPVAPEGDRTGPCDDDNAMPLSECGFQRDLHVTDDVDGRGKNLGEERADVARQFATSGARSTDASARDLRGRDPGGRTSLLHGFVQRFARLGGADPHDVAGPRGHSGQQIRLVSYGAGRLGPAAVNAKVKRHGFISNTDSSPLAALTYHARRGLQSLTRANLRLL